MAGLPKSNYIFSLWQHKFVVLSEPAILASNDAITVAYIPQSICFSVLTFHIFDMFHQNTKHIGTHTLKLETSKPADTQS